jgi:hypothetical protein
MKQDKACFQLSGFGKFGREKAEYISTKATTDDSSHLYFLLNEPIASVTNG